MSISFLLTYKWKWWKAHMLSLVSSFLGWLANASTFNFPEMDWWRKLSFYVSEDEMRWDKIRWGIFREACTRGAFSQPQNMLVCLSGWVTLIILHLAVESMVEEKVGTVFRCDNERWLMKKIPFNCKKPITLAKWSFWYYCIVDLGFNRGKWRWSCVTKSGARKERGKVKWKCEC